MRQIVLILCLKIHFFKNKYTQKRAGIGAVAGIHFGPDSITVSFCE
jgi:hypothetical protein